MGVGLDDEDKAENFAVGAKPATQLEVRPTQAVMVPTSRPVRDIRGGGMVAPIIPQTVQDVALIASAVIKAGLAPDSYEEKSGSPEDRADKTKSKIMIGIMKGAEVGLPPITALSTIAIINGRPTIWGDGAVALAQNSGLLERMEETWEGGAEKTSAPTTTTGGEKDYTPAISDFADDFTAIVRLWRKGQDKPYEGRFSVRDAKRAHLWGNSKKTPWIEYPKRMLKARARAFAIRDGFADALHGLSIREEMEDLPAAPPTQTDTGFLEDAPKQIAPPSDKTAGTESFVTKGDSLPVPANTGKGEAA